MKNDAEQNISDVGSPVGETFLINGHRVTIRYVSNPSSSTILSEIQRILFGNEAVIKIDKYLQ